MPPGMQAINPGPEHDRPSARSRDGLTCDRPVRRDRRPPWPAPLSVSAARRELPIARISRANPMARRKPVHKTRLTALQADCL